MEKMQYEEVQIEIIKFTNEDVITDSELTGAYPPGSKT